MDRYTYRVELAYDGAHFAGFARQVGQRTIEGTLAAALAPLVPEIETVSVGGRTDRGVNATGQVISFWSRPRLALEAIAGAIDSAAPGELSVSDVREVPRSFHAHFSACSRRYVYFSEDPTLDVARIDRMLLALIGRRDFTAFARDTPKNKTTVRTLFDARIRRCEQGVRFDFAADGFLRHQIRVLVATAIAESKRADAGEGVLVELAQRADRRATARPAPAGGLYLVKIGYEPRPAMIVRSSSDMT